MKRKRLTVALLSLLGVLVIYSCASEEKLTIPDFSGGRNLAVRLYRNRLRKFIIEYDLDAAVQYCSDLTRNPDPVFSQLGEQYINHLSEVYYETAGAMRKAGRIEEAVDAYISAEALNPAYRSANEGLKPQLRREMIRYHLERGDRESALLLYEYVKRTMRQYTISALENAYSKRSTPYNGSMLDFTEAMKADVPAIRVRYSYTDDKGIRYDEVISRTGILIDDTSVLTDYYAIHPRVYGELEAPFTYTLHFPDGKDYDCELSAYDAINGLALLKINGERRKPAMEYDEYAGNSAYLRRGERIHGVGCPLLKKAHEVRGSITSTEERGLLIGQCPKTDIVVPDENHGAPVFNANGKLVGLISSANRSKEGGVTLIPVNLFRESYFYLQKNQFYPYTWAGLVIERGDERIEGRPLNVLHVFPGSPAYLAGIRPDDILLSVNHRPVSTFARAQEQIALRLNGGVTRFGMKRGEREYAVYVVNHTRPLEPDIISYVKVHPVSYAPLYLGFTYTPSESGGRIAAVEADSEAYRKGIRAGGRAEAEAAFFYAGRLIVRLRYFHPELNGGYKSYTFESEGIAENIL